MSEKRGDTYDVTYYVDHPIYVTERNEEYLISILMGNVWVKAVTRDILIKKYGVMNL